MSFALFSLLSLIPLLASATTLSAASNDNSTLYALSPKSFPDLCVAPSGSSPSSGSSLVLKSCDSSDIAWTLSGSALENSDTSLCIDVTDGGDWSGNKMQVWSCYSENVNQMFTMNGNMIRWSGQDMCLDLTDGQGVEGTRVQIWSCSDNNPNQQWIFSEVEVVGDDTGCDDTSSSDSTTSAAATPTTTSDATVAITDAATAVITDAPTAAVTDAVTSASIASSASAAQNSSSLGGELWAGGSGGSHKHRSSSAAHATSTSDWSDGSSSDSWASATSSATWAASTSSGSWDDASSTTDSWNATSSAAWGSASATASASSSKTSSASNSSSTGSVSTGSSDMSGYLQASGSKVVDASGNTVTLKGVNLGGWLVWEDWMCGFSDSSGGADRFAQTTLENRFGESKTDELVQAWQDNWLVSSDFDKIAAMGYNVVRLPFSFRTLQNADGSWKTDSSGNVDMSRLDWAVAQAKQRGIYTIPTFHIWDTQAESYSLISENSDAGQASRDKAGEIWKKVGAHFQGEASIAAFDAINEPTGSWGDLLQQDLYTAIRSVDPKRLIVMESISTNPSNYGWTNVIYSLHEYLMMGSDEGYSQSMWNSGAAGDISSWLGMGVPVYLGEFMADGDTLSWLLQQVEGYEGVWWSSWTYKTVNMGRWGLYNFGGWNVDVGSASFDDIKSQFTNMGGITKQDVANTYISALGGSSSSKRSAEAEAESPRVGSSSVAKRVYEGRRHSRRSRLQHGQKSSF